MLDINIGFPSLIVTKCQVKTDNIEWETVSNVNQFTYSQIAQLRVALMNVVVINLQCDLNDDYPCLV